MTPPTRTHPAALGLSVALAILAAGCDATTPTAAVDAGSSISPAQVSAKKVQPTVQTCTECVVEVNVKHGNDQGKINLKGIRNSDGNSGNGSGASLTVSVLGTTEFNLSVVDLSTIRIGDATTTPITPLEQLKNKYQASIVDLNGDGILDLMLHFSIQEMVDNGNLSEATTSLCLVGTGPTYTIVGCGGVTVSGDTGGGNGGGGGKVTYSTVDLIPWSAAAGSPDNKLAWVTRIPYDSETPEDPLPGYPDGYTGWRTIGLDVLQAGTGVWASFEQAQTPFAKQASEAQDISFLETCGVTPSAYNFPIYGQLLVRADIEVPAGAKNVTIESLVDNKVWIFIDGTDPFGGFMFTDQGSGECPNTATPASLAVDKSLLPSDGSATVIKLAMWVVDRGYANYFDFHVTADIPN